MEEIFKNMEEDWKKFSEEAEKFIQKYGTPHTKIIVDESGIEIVQGVKAKPFEIVD